MLAKFIPHDSHHIIGYEDWVPLVFMEACHPHLQVDLLANLQCEHNAGNAKRKTVPTSRKSLGGSGEDYKGILGPRDQDRETDMLGKRALTPQPRANGLSVGTKLNQRTFFVAFPRMHRRFPEDPHREVSQLLNVYFGIKRGKVESAFAGPFITMSYKGKLF